MRIEIICEWCGQASSRNSRLVFPKMFCNRSCRTAYRQSNAKAPYREVQVNGKRKYHHRAVMEKQLGRELASTELVHHADRNGWHNDPGNLEVMTPSQHGLEHSRIAWGVDRAIEMAGNGASIPAIADVLGVSYKAVWRALRLRKIETITPTRESAVDIHTAKELLKTGMSYRAIARAMGFTHGTISKAIKN